MTSRISALTALIALVLVSGLEAQKTAPKASQKIDEEYTRLIKQNLQDPRITTELVDHLPASDTVPSPLKFLGHAVGTLGELTYAKDIYRPATKRSRRPRRGGRSTSKSARRKKAGTSSCLRLRMKPRSSRW